MQGDNIQQSVSEAAPPATSAGAPRAETSLRAPVAMVVGAVVVAAALAGLLHINRQQVAPPPRVLSPGSQAYAEQLEFLELSLSAADNMVGSQIVYLDGLLANRGTQTVRLLRLRLDFQDTLGQVILREERDLVPIAISSVGPGQVRPFQLRFDYPPASWNIQPPEMGVLSLVIE